MVTSYKPGITFKWCFNKINQTTEDKNKLKKPAKTSREYIKLTNTKYSHREKEREGTIGLSAGGAVYLDLMVTTQEIVRERDVHIVLEKLHCKLVSSNTAQFKYALPTL